MMFLFFIASAFAADSGLLELPARYAYGSYHLTSYPQAPGCADGEIHIEQDGTVLVLNATERINLVADVESRQHSCVKHVVTSLTEDKSDNVLIYTYTKFQNCADTTDEHSENIVRWNFHGSELVIGHSANHVNKVCYYERR